MKSEPEDRRAEESKPVFSSVGAAERSKLGNCRQIRRNCAVLSSVGAAERSNLRNCRRIQRNCAVLSSVSAAGRSKLRNHHESEQTALCCRARARNTEDAELWSA